MLRRSLTQYFRLLTFETGDRQYLLTTVG